MTPEILLTRAEALLVLYRQAGRTIATAESCTGGHVIAFLTDIPGSSAVVERGFVTYSNEAKQEMLGVEAALIERHGAVSAEVAEAMVRGAIARSHADAAVAITGIAGPGGATETKPVGLVYFGTCNRGGEAHHERTVFGGDRRAVRLAAVGRAFDLLENLCRRLDAIP